jgi:hypothetical protein
MTAFVLGMSAGIAIAFLVAGWFTFAKRSPVVTIDPWWLENEDRWASLRPVLLKERAANGRRPSDG